jgi:hypothetical protein
MGCESLEEFIKRNCYYGGMAKIGKNFWETKDLDVADIAKRVRKDIKEAVSQGRLSDKARYSVRIRRFSGGQAIDLKATDVPDERDWPFNTRRALKAIINSYNYDFSDSMVDYCSNRFYNITEVNGKQY